MIKRQIPNLITLGNLMCGVESIFTSLVTGNVCFAAIWICAGIFLDFFDGLAARLLGVASPLGKELDSLADVVTSGIAPAFIMFRMVEVPMKELFPLWSVILIMLPFVLMPAFAAYRLAKFNIDTRQSHSFLGLPVPANALIWVGLALSGISVTNLALAIILAVVAMFTNIQLQGHDLEDQLHSVYLPGRMYIAVRHRVDILQSQLGSIVTDNPLVYLSVIATKETC